MKSLRAPKTRQSTDAEPSFFDRHPILKNAVKYTTYVALFAVGVANSVPTMVLAAFTGTVILLESINFFRSETRKNIAAKKSDKSAQFAAMSGAGSAASDVDFVVVYNSGIKRTYVKNQDQGGTSARLVSSFEANKRKDCAIQLHDDSSDECHTDDEYSSDDDYFNDEECVGHISPRRAALRTPRG